MTGHADAVRAFHEAIGDIGVDRSPSVFGLRARLIDEEAGEVIEALATGDLDHVAKELADLLYVVYGTAHRLGVDLDEAFRRVHASNMSKLVDGRPLLRGDGKVLKPPTYRPPDMSGCVIEEVAR